jgi:hypothetical protein
VSPSSTSSVESAANDHFSIGDESEGKWGRRMIQVKYFSV